jgi:hypothetical protein
MNVRLTKIVSLLFYIDAFIWLIGMVPTLYYAFTQDNLPSLGGIRLLGGPFESLGMSAFLLAGLMYIFVSALKILAAYWLGKSRKEGAILGFILLGMSIIFWYGFALPLGPLLGVAQIVLLILVWNTLL